MIAGAGGAAGAGAITGDGTLAGTAAIAGVGAVALRSCTTQAIVPNKTISAAKINVKRDFMRPLSVNRLSARHRSAIGRASENQAAEGHIGLRRLLKSFQYGVGRAAGR